ncbi:MAG: 30S ribosomal protein S12 methylthiotransferase RimO [Victivallales bacterium]|nr:30S ribosomal protein S12 methylthiotransferase RimO [Victivallales bacterium]
MSRRISSSPLPSSPPLAVQVISLGCAKNLVDAEVMCGCLATHGICLTTDPDAADFTLINTCGFIQSARDEAEAAIRDAIRWKKDGRRKALMRRIIVGGCLAQRSAPEYAVRFPEVDCFIGIDAAPQVHEIILRLASQPPSGTPEILVAGQEPAWLYDEKTPRIQVTPPSYAYIKIAEGCNHRCSFCAIPGIRGNLRSRAPESVLAECRQLLANGVRELDLIAQDTTAYGFDLQPRQTLAGLLRQIEELPGDFWVRILYTHPLHLTPDFLALLGNGRHLVPYLDVPLQHIADPILKSMRRGMTTAATRELMTGIRERYPGMVIRTTFMTGYPGETDAAFQTLLAFVQEMKFDRLGVFAYSPEPGTPAAQIREGLVPAEVAESRRRQLLELQRGISRQNNRALVGKSMSVLVEKRLRKGLWSARGIADAPEVDPTVFIHVDHDRLLKPNCFVTAQITQAGEYDLKARLPQPTPPP